MSQEQFKVGDWVRAYMNPVNNISPPGGFMGKFQVIRITKGGAVRVAMTGGTKLFRYDSLNRSWTCRISHWNWIHIEQGLW